MSSPEEVAAKVWGGKPKNWKVVDNFDSDWRLQETIRKHEREVFVKRVLAEIDKEINYANEIGVQDWNLKNVKERIEKL